MMNGLASRVLLILRLVVSIRTEEGGKRKKNVNLLDSKLNLLYGLWSLHERLHLLDKHVCLVL